MTLQQIEKINPDEKGIIKVTEDGRERRFIKDKLIAWLKANGILKGELTIDRTEK